MRKMEILLLLLVGGAAYLTFAQPSATSAQNSPTPTITSLPSAPGATAPLASSGSNPNLSPPPTSTNPSITSILSTSPATTNGGSTSTLSIPQTPANAGSTSIVSTAPAMPTQQANIPPDSYFVQQLQAAYTQATGISSGKFFTYITNLATACLASLALQTGSGDNCSGYSAPNVGMTALGLSQVGAQSGLSIAASAGLLTAGAAGIATAGIGLAVAAVASIFAAHAAKVKAQAQYDCAAVAAANNAISQIRQAISQNLLSAQGAYQALESVYSGVVQLLQSSPAPPNTGQGHCNNPCNLIFVTRAVVDKFEAMYGLSAAS